MRVRNKYISLRVTGEEKKLLYEKAKELDIQPGVGLAAPQIGVLKKMFVVLTYDDNGKLHKYALVNPKLISNSVAQCYLATGEGCLSVPEAHQGLVKRAHRLK